MDGRRLSRFVAFAALSAAPAAAGVTPSVFGGRIACAELESGVQFCQGDVAHRVESFDGVPLDVNVTLPPAAEDGPFPLVVELHGYSQAKSAEPSTERALAGYAVVNYSARGFGESCGSMASRAPDASLPNPDVCAERGWVRLADARYEARDTQHLAGLLADEGLILPSAVAVTGPSYGGGQSMMLAALRNRTMLPDGSLVPWQSPGGLDMEIAAAAALIPWSDLAESLVPAGRTLDYRAFNPYGARAGIQKQSWVNFLYIGGLLTGFYAPDGIDPEADLPGWKAALDAGEPYDGNPVAEAALDQVTSYHSAYYLDDSIPPAPLFVYSAWTDDLFPADEAVRFWRKTRELHPDAELALHFADLFGHPRAGLANGLGAVPERIEAFLARHLKGTGEPLPEIETYTQACETAAVEGPFVADDWDALHPGEVRFRARKAQRYDAASGDPAVAAFLEPVSGPPCRTLPALDDPGAASWRLPPASGAGYTLLGAPTVIATIDASGSYAQVAARLWDVAPGGTQSLVSHGFYRPRSDNLGPQVFQLHPNGWRFAPGHVAKLELLGQSPTFGREAGGPFHVTISDLELRLPVREAPDGGDVLAPAPFVLPPEDPEPADTGTPSCPAEPQDDCSAGEAGSLTLAADARPERERLAWTWKGAPADFGDPTATTAFRLCVYDASDALVANVAAPAGGRCGSGRQAKDCWKEKRRGFRFGGRPQAADGLAALALAGTGAKASVTLRARGPGLALPALPLALPARVQLVGNRDACWEARYSEPAQRNDAGDFRDRAD